MMTDKEFDERIKELCGSVEIMPEPGGWDRMEKTLARKRRRSLLLRAGYAAAAAAAVLAGVFLWPYDSAGIIPEISSSVTVTPPVADAFEKDLSVLPGGGAAGLEVQLVADASENDMSVQTGGLSESGIPVPVSEVPVESFESDEAVSDGRDSGESAGRSLAGQLELGDYLSFAEEDDRPVRKRSISLDASSDLYTLFGSGNVSFSRRSMSGGAGSGADFTVKPLNGEYPTHSFPLSFALNVKFSFGRFGLGTGINYTFLKNSYEALVYDYAYMPALTYQATVDQSLHYLGIPVLFSCDIIGTEKVSFYALAGGMVEKGFGLKYRIDRPGEGISYKSVGVDGLQWSVNLGLGAEYRFLPFVGVYADPRLTYYFYCDQPYSIRLEQPLQFDLNIGLRFHF